MNKVVAQKKEKVLNWKAVCSKVRSITQYLKAPRPHRQKELKKPGSFYFLASHTYGEKVFLIFNFLFDWYDFFILIFWFSLDSGAPLSQKKCFLESDSPAGHCSGASFENDQDET